MAGLVEGLVPPSLEEEDLIGNTSAATTHPVSGALGSDDEEPPEEVINQAAPKDFARGLEAAAEVDRAREQQEAPMTRKRQRKNEAAAAAETTNTEDAKDSALLGEGNGAEFFWQKEESKPVLDALRQQEEKRRKRHKAGKVEKDGVVLVRSDHILTAKDAHGHASDFLQRELFERRKRIRNPKDTRDRNQKGRMLGVHRME